MITREDILKLGWTEEDHGTFDAYTLNGYSLTFGQTGKYLMIEDGVGGDVVYYGSIPDYNALVLLMDWLGIKHIPAVSITRYNPTTEADKRAFLQQYRGGSFGQFVENALAQAQQPPMMLSNKEGDWVNYHDIKHLL
jgi:hypothetical protein